MIKKLPKDLPVFLASLVFLAIIAFGASYMFHEFKYRAPNSTFATSFIILPIAALFYAFIAFLVGAFAKWLWEKYSNTVYSSKQTFSLIYFLIAILFIVLGVWASIYDMGNI